MAPFRHRLQRFALGPINATEKLLELLYSGLEADCEFVMDLLQVRPLVASLPCGVIGRCECSATPARADTRYIPRDAVRLIFPLEVALRKHPKFGGAEWWHGPQV